MTRLLGIAITLVISFSSLLFAQQPSVDDIAHRAMDNVSPPGTVDNARYISFTLNVESGGKTLGSYPERWDRFTGEYRVSGRTADGLSFDVTLNVNTSKGNGKINGQAVTDLAKFRELFAIGYRRFVSDTNMLLMPFKLFYPGVHRTYDGQRTDSCGHTWDLIKLTFDKATDLPTGDVYWLWVNRNTGIVEEWDFKPEGSKAEERPQESDLQAYQRVGGLLLSTRRAIRGNGQVIRFDDLKILPDVPPGAFE